MTASKELRPRIDRPEARVWYGVFAEDVTSMTDLAKVILPDFHDHRTWGPARWQSRDGITLPNKGDECLVTFDNRMNPWIMSWWSGNAPDPIPVDVTQAELDALKYHVLSSYGPAHPAGWRPFSATSPWNKPIPAAPTISPSSAAIVAKLVGWGAPASTAVATASSSVGGKDFDSPVYYSRPSDPLYTIGPTADAYSGWSALYGQTFRALSGLKGASGSDDHLSVVDILNNNVYEFFHFQYTTTGHRAPLIDGPIIARSGSKHPLDGSGWLPSDGGPQGIGTDAVGSAHCAGQICYEDLQYGAIEHALRMVTKSTSGAIVLPAVHSANTSDPVNAPPSGARFQLNMTFAEIEALTTASPYTKLVYKAMSKYGMYVCDTGSQPWNLQVNSSQPWLSAGLADPWKTLAAASAGFSYYGTGDYYLWALDGGIDWSTKLRVLDWTDPANR